MKNFNSKTFIIAVVIIVLAIGFALVLRNQKQNEALFSGVKKITCVYPVIVSGNSMEPALKAGTRAMFSRCLENRDKLELGTIVVYQGQDKVKKIGRIKERVEDSRGVFYKISRDQRPEIDEVSMHSIEAVYQK